MSRHPAGFILAITLISLVATGCSLAPRYTRPNLPVDEQWGAHASDQPTNRSEVTWSDDVQWQDFVLEPQLRELVQVALENNRDLRQSVLAIDAARAQLRLARGAQLPNVEAGGSHTRERIPAAVSPSGQSLIQESAQSGVTLGAFELDLFGRLRSLANAAGFEYHATAEDARAVRLALISQVCNAYVEWQGAQERVALVQSTLEGREKSLGLTEMSHQLGAVGDLDVQEARAALADVQAQKEQALRARARAKHALTLLLGHGDTPLVEHAGQTPTLDQRELFAAISPGLPSDLITRRPEVLSAEQRLRARNADVGAARAAFLPNITLTGTGGSVSAEVDDLFSAGTRSWSFVPRITIPLFAGGRLKAGLDLSEVRRDSAVAAYEGAIQTGFREVSDALVDASTYEQEASAQQRSVVANSRAAELSRARYRAGADSHLRYLDAERQRLSAQLALLEAHIQRHNSRPALFKAMGGGWVGER